jgi:hypothetical protein
MLSRLRSKHAHSSHRRTIRRAGIAREELEARTLLSSAAVIRWQMLPQIFHDVNHGSQPDLPNTPAYVNPPGGFGVLLNASHSIGILPTTTFTWTVTDALGQTTPLSGEQPSINLPQGPYTVKLEAIGLLNHPRPQFSTAKIQVKDVLIVSIGDSYASGEGNPVIPGFFSPQWAYSPDPAMNLENANAHRSTIAGPAQFALQLQESNPHLAVTFVSVANSGASIPVGLLGPMPSIGNSSYQLPAEIDELKNIIGTRHIDVLTLTVGGDDVGFATLAQDLIENTLLSSPTLQSIQTQFDTSLQGLPQHFAELAHAIQSLNPGQVLMTGYPDVTRNQNGRVAAIIGLGDTLVSKTDARFASANIIAPLNSTVASAAKTYHWTLLSKIAADFRTHGYPSTQSWIRTLGQSIEMQGNYDGVFHPNMAGHLDFAKNFLATYLSQARKLKGRK